MKFEYLVTRLRLKWTGGDFWLEAEVDKEPMNISTLGEEGWEFIGFYPDANAIGDINKGYKDGRDGWVPPNERVGIFKRRVD